MKLKAPLSTLAATAGLLAVVAWWPAQRVAAQEPTPSHERYDFPAVGFVPGETIRVSASNLQPPPIGEVPPPTACRVRIVLFDVTGERVADSGPILFPPGPTRIFDVPRGALNRPGEERTSRLQVRAMVIVSNLEGFPPGPSVPSLEIVNTTTGRTSLVVFPPGPTRF
jgi:hypothetical protein